MSLRQHACVVVLFCNKSSATRDDSKKFSTRFCSLSAIIYNNCSKKFSKLFMIHNDDMYDDDDASYNR